MKKFLTSFLLVLSFASLTACKGGEKSIEDVYQGSPEVFNANKDDVMKDFDQMAAPKAGDKIAVIETDMGTIKIKLFPEFAPKTVENFVKLAGEGFYDGLIFHRVIPGFMIQGGDPDGNGQGGPGYTVPAEITPNLVHFKGALATARLPDQINPNKDSSGSQFYIVQGDARFLDNNYTVFGQTFEGMDIVDAIAAVDRDGNDKPLEDIVMEKVTVEIFN